MFAKYAVLALVAGALLLSIPALAADVEKGVSLYNQKDYNGAVGELQAAVDADPANRRARYYLALSFIELQRFDEADTHVKQLESQEGTPPEPAELKLAAGRVAMGKNDLDSAQQYLDQARDANPNSAEIFQRRGELALKRQDYQTAVKELERSREIDPNQAYTHYFLGMAYGNVKRPDKMVEHFEIFRKLAPNAPEVKKVETLLHSVRR
jgi:tetratricopeptide (TPR) repeat protein